MADGRPHILHLSVAEQGKIHLLAGRHQEALRHFREAMRIAAAARAPEIFFRHYTQCVLEALELAGHHGEVIDICREADAQFTALASSRPSVAREHGAMLERLAVALLLEERREEAAEALRRAVELAGAGALPLAETLAQWIARGFAVPPTMLRQAQRRHRYFTVRSDQVDRRIARQLPPGTPAAMPASVLG